jgi:hypothetical protein
MTDANRQWMERIQAHTPERQAAYEAAFRAVQNTENWKNPIDAVVAADKLAITVEAIAWFAGSATTVTPLPDGTFKVTAPGYYRSVGA